MIQCLCKEIDNLDQKSSKERIYLCFKCKGNYTERLLKFSLFGSRPKGKDCECFMNCDINGNVYGVHDPQWGFEFCKICNDRFEAELNKPHDQGCYCQRCEVDRIKLLGQRLPEFAQALEVITKEI